MWCDRGHQVSNSAVNTRNARSTLALTLIAILVLIVADTALARVDREATRATAADEYRVGVNLIDHNRLTDAIEHLRTAATLDREKAVYTVALAQAVLADGRAADNAFAHRVRLSRRAPRARRGRT